MRTRELPVHPIADPLGAALRTDGSNSFFDIFLPKVKAPEPAALRGVNDSGSVVERSVLVTDTVTARRPSTRFGLFTSAGEPEAL
jgi:hypothetical protein